MIFEVLQPKLFYDSGKIGDFGLEASNAIGSVFSSPLTMLPFTSVSSLLAFHVPQTYNPFFTICVI